MSLVVGDEIFTRFLSKKMQIIGFYVPKNAEYNK